MDEKKLRDRLTELHAELEAAHRQDPDARKSLGDILPDIKRAAEGPAAGAGSEATTLSERLEKVAVQFEAEHPAVAGSVRRLVDLLGEVGI